MSSFLAPASVIEHLRREPYCRRCQEQGRLKIADVCEPEVKGGLCLPCVEELRLEGERGRKRLSELMQGGMDPKKAIAQAAREAKG